MDHSKMLSLPALSEQIAERRISPTDIVERCLARVAERDPNLRAWAYVASEDSRRQAQLRTDELSSSAPLGPLHGIPFGVKDIFDTAGMPTGWGCSIYNDRVPDQDADLVAQLKKAGAIVLGKTHTTGFAYFDPAPTRNPYNAEHTPGGSSSGSAAAVADGMIPFALGSQTQGSVLRPASFCGIVGLKPTFGALPVGGVLPFAPTLDHPGLFTRTVEEMAWLWRAATEASSAAAASKPRLARPPWPITGTLEPEMAQGFDRAVAKLSTAGFEIIDIKPPESFSDLPEAAMTVFRYEGAQTHKQRFEQYGGRIGTKLSALVIEGLRIDANVYERALALLAKARVEFAAQAESNPLWITPSALGPAPRGLASTGDPRANAPFTALGVPAISLPFGYSPSGLPMGLQLAAAQGQEDTLLSAALACEQCLRWNESAKQPSPL